MPTGIDTSFYPQAKPADAMTTLRDVAGIAGAIQNVQRGQVSLTQETGRLNARNAIAKLVTDPQYQKEDGSPDLDKLAPAAYQADPQDYYATDMVKKYSSAKADTLRLSQLGSQIGQETGGYIGSMAGAMAYDPEITKAKVLTGLDDVVRVAQKYGKGTQASEIADIAKRGLDNLPDEPGPIANALRNFRNKFAMGAQAQQPAVEGVQTGAGTQYVQKNPFFAPPAPTGQTVPNAIGPAGAEIQRQDVLGNSYIEARDASGHVTPKAMPGASMPPLLSFPPGESQQTASALAASRNASNDAARTIPEQHFNNAQIVKLADATTTGEGAKILANLKGRAAGIPWTSDAATNFDNLGHFVALQAGANAKAMGLNTSDAKVGLSGEMTASTGWTRDAIKRATKINDALASGVDYFNRGLEKAINDPANQKSIFAARDFQNAWAQAFDVNAMRLLNAKLSGNDAEVKAIVKEVGGKNSDAAKTLAAQVGTLDSLVTQGHP